MEYGEMRTSAVLIVSAAFGLPAIPPAAAQPSNTPGACGLPYREADEQAFGPLVGAGRTQVSNRIVTSCAFSTRGGATISILFRRQPGRDWIEEQEQRMQQAARYGSFRPIANLGERSFVFDMHEAGAALCVFRADSYLQVSVFRAGGVATILAGAEKVARAALTVLDPPLVAQTGR